MKEGYYILIHENQFNLESTREIIWNKITPTNVSLFCVVVDQLDIPTKENLDKRGILEWSMG